CSFPTRRSSDSLPTRRSSDLTFAARFAKAHGAKYGIALANGTVAIEVALKAIGIKPGDEVIVPAYTWEGTVGPVLLLNAVPVFVDRKSTRLNSSHLVISYAVF